MLIGLFVTSCAWNLIYSFTANIAVTIFWVNFVSGVGGFGSPYMDWTVSGRGKIQMARCYSIESDHMLKKVR
jgi:hypothetical protein